MTNKSWLDLIKDHKTLFTIVIIGFFLIEIEIFAVAIMKSGRQSWMNVVSDSGEIIYQVKGSTLTNFNKYYFENTFGSIDDYQVKLVSKDVPFPFRGWFAAAIGVPVGLILLLAFVLKSVMALFFGKKNDVDYGAEHEAQRIISKDDEDDEEREADAEEKGTQVKHRRSKKKSKDTQSSFGPFASAESLLNQISRLNIFIIGFLILSGVMLYLVIPDLLAFLAKAGIETILNFKWFFIAVLAAMFLLFAGFMYMKYQLAQKSLDAQTEVKKYEIKMEYARYDNALPAPENMKEKEPPMIEYSEVDYEEMENEKK